MSRYRTFSDRYKKVLVTCSMGFRSEDDVRKNGLHIFTKDKKNELIKCLNELFSKNNSVLALKIGMKGYHSEHVLINSADDVSKFIKEIDSIFNSEHEIWIVSSSVIDCFRGRIYISRDGFSDYIEISYSKDDHILDHLSVNSSCPYVFFTKEMNIYKVSYTNMSRDMLDKVNLIVKDILLSYGDVLSKVRDDLNILDINGISLDVRVNDGYDFHDFDVSYDDVKKVIDYYVEPFLEK